MIGETVTILRAGTPTTDRYGNEVPGADQRLDVYGCAVAPRADADITGQGRQGVIVGTTIYFPPATDVRATDRLEVRGETHDIVGDPGDWRSPYSGRARGVEVSTRRAEG